MTENGNSTENIRDVWAQFKVDRASELPDVPINKHWEEVKAQPPIQPLTDVTFTAQELTDFFNFRHRPGLASWGEFCADKGYNISEAIQPLIDRKNMEHRQSIVATKIQEPKQIQGKLKK